MNEITWDVGFRSVWDCSSSFSPTASIITTRMEYGRVRTQLTTLKDWYNTNLVPQYKTGDGYDSQHNLEYITFRPKYYLLGLSNGAQNSNVDLPQTIGWQDYNNGGANGTFDPLAE